MAAEAVTPESWALRSSWPILALYLERLSDMAQEGEPKQSRRSRYVKNTRDWSPGKIGQLEVMG